MERVEKWLFPGTPIATLLRTRPLAISILEKYGVDPWDHSIHSIGDVCANKGISMEGFFAEMKALPEPDCDTDWKTRPVSHLIDFLTREHWQLTHHLLPLIQHTLAHEHVGDAESLRRLRYLVEEWPGFSEALQEHIQEEEAFLFPKILRYDYCLRHKVGNADFFNGSVNVYVALQMLGNEKKQMASVRRFLNEVMFSTAADEATGSLEERIEPLLAELQSKLLNHSALETNTLFPMANKLEKKLMDTMIAGGSGGFKRLDTLFVF